MPHADDANGDVLRNMESKGDDLSRPRDIDFTVVFPDKNTAQQFADHFRALDYKVSLQLTNTAEGFPWDVLVVKHMAPSHQGIGAFEDELQRVADNFGGHNDGWGCFSGPSPSTST